MSRKRVSLALLSAVSAAFALPAAGEDDNHGVLSVTSENDLFGGTDRNYTNGLRIERVRPAGKVPDVLADIAPLIPGLDLERTELRQGFAVAHAIFTPEDISRENPDPDDRPYAGWLHLSSTVVARDDDTEDSLQLNLGMVGETAAGKFVQRNFHDLIDGEDPRGWDYQLKDEPGIEIVAQRLQIWRPEARLPFNLQYDYGVHGGGAIGNVRTYAAIGALARIGWDLESDFGPPRIRPALSGAGVFDPSRNLGGYVFAGVDARFVARDIFLDGNTFRDSRRVDDRRPVVGDLQAGIAVHYQDVQVAFTYVHRTEQFIAQDGPQRFGAVSISVAM